MPERSARRPARERELWAWPLALALLTRLPDLFLRYRDWDEAAMMAQAWAMTRGQVLYRDVFQIHPPLHLLLFASFFRALPAAVAPHAIKALNTVLVVLDARLAAAIVRRWTNDFEAALAAAALCAWLLGRPWALSSYGEFYMLLPLLASVWLLQDARPRWAAAGALWGAAFFLKQVAVFDAAALAAGFALIRRPRPASAARSLARAALGFGAVAAAVAAWEASQGALADAIRLVLLFPLQHYAAPGVPMLWRVGAYARMILLPALAALSPCWLAAAAAARAGRRPSAAEAAGAPICALWLAAVAAEIWCTGQLNRHYTLAFVPPASLLAGLALSRLRAARWPRLTRAATALLVAAAAAACVPDLRALAANGWRDTVVKGSDALAAGVRARTRDGDKIFLYGIWNLDVFYLSDRLASQGVYMYIDMESRHMHDSALEARIETGLRADPPALILVNNTARFQRTSYPPVRDFFFDLLAQRYVRTAALDIADLYLLKD